MLDRIFRVKAGGAALKPHPGQGCADLTMLQQGQAVARLDYNVYQGWYLVFADTPGDGLFLGYVHESAVQPLDALTLASASVAAAGSVAPGEVHAEHAPSPSVPTTVTPVAEGKAQPPPTLSQAVEASSTAAPPAVTPATPPLVPPPPPPLFPASVVPDTLSAHFALDEFTRSETGAKLKIDNTPPPDIIEKLKVTAGRMEQVRELLGGKPIRINSGYRNPKLNAAVGGTPTSDHMSGYAVDFTCKDFGSPYEICCAIRDSGLMQHVDQLIHEKLRWVHISFDPRCSKECLSFFDREDGTTVRLKGILPRDPG